MMEMKTVDGSCINRWLMALSNIVVGISRIIVKANILDPNTYNLWVSTYIKLEIVFS